MDIEKAITDGIVFKGGKSSGRKNEEKVKTKAKKLLTHSIIIMKRIIGLRPLLPSISRIIPSCTII